MSIIKVYGGAGGSSLRVHWMLNEAGQSYETIKVDVNGGANKQPEFLAVNPAGQVPAMEIDGMKFAESVAITQYLAEKYMPELLGKTPEERAAALQWGLWTMLNPQKALLDLAFMVWRNAPDEAKSASANELLAKQLPILENHLASHAYVAGEAFTTGDIIAATSLTYGGVSKFDYSTYPNITRWMAACTSRPAFVKATAPAVPAV